MRIHIFTIPSEFLTDPKSLFLKAGFSPAKYSPTESDLFSVLAAPDGNHFLGTDGRRRDVLSGMIHGEQPYTFLLARKSTVAVHRRFHNVRLYPLGFDTREWFVPEGLRKYSN